MYLLDTMVISEGAKSRPDPAVGHWLETVPPERLFVSVVSLGEFQRGIAKLTSLEGEPPERYIRWSIGAVERFGERVLPVTLAVARRWGELSFRLGHANADLFIAATALEHDLTVVTRNIRHFEPTGAKTFDPYETP